MQPQRRLPGAAHRQDSGRVSRKSGRACTACEKARGAQTAAAHQAQLPEYLSRDGYMRPRGSRPLRCRISILRGRKTVRADHRLGTDEKHIRAQSAISYKTPALSMFLSITVFSVRMRFSSVQKTRLARAARKQAKRVPDLGVLRR